MMKGLLPILFLCSIISAQDPFGGIDVIRAPTDPSLPDAVKYHEEMLEVQARYRDRLAKFFQDVDGVEVLRLDFETVEKFSEDEWKEYFPILPYNRYSKILDSKRLYGGKVCEGRDAMIKVLEEENGWEGGAFCHYPIHGIRHYKGDHLDSNLRVLGLCQLLRPISRRRL